MICCNGYVVQSWQIENPFFTFVKTLTIWYSTNYASKLHFPMLPSKNIDKPPSVYVQIKYVLDKKKSCENIKFWMRNKLMQHSILKMYNDNAYIH